MAIARNEVTGETAERRKLGFAADLLTWYDANARSLVWRAAPGGAPPEPYRVWLAEVMLQQTTVAAVTPRYQRFLELYPTVQDLAEAPQADVLGEWAGLGYYARARNLHACAKVVASSGWPRTEAGLRGLPGLGPYTAASVAAIAFGERAVVVDANVARVIARLFAIERVARQGDAEVRRLAHELTPTARPGDYAQAMMDLGATICRAKTPDCLICPVRSHCDAAARGLADELPIKPAKKARPLRTGSVFIARRGDGAVLCEQRPLRGLYGGMTGLPGSDWAVRAGAPPFEPPVAADWQKAGVAKHALTHFELRLDVYVGPVADASGPFFFLPPERFTALPTVFRRCLDVLR